MQLLNHSNLAILSPFKEECLNLIASWLLEEWRNTEDDLVRETDTAYTKGTTLFGRQKQRISLEYLSQKHTWLQVLNNGADIVFSVSGVPCRFSNDNPNAPQKRAIREPHPIQMSYSLFEESTLDEAARFVFVIDKTGFDDASEPRVMLLGFSHSGQEVSRWTYGGSIRLLSSVNASAPEPVELRKPVVTVKRPIADDDVAASNGS